MPEFEARTVKEAIALGLETLGLSQDDAIIEILEEGRSGVFGMGAKDAVVRITSRPDESASDAAEELATPEAPADSIPTEQEPEPEAPAQPEEEPAPELASDLDPEDEYVLGIGRDFLQGLMERMGLSAQVAADVIFGEDETTYRLNITGDDLGILIGRRAETLDALQYITRLVVNQQTHRWYRIEVDVENYKQRREQSLQRLAQNMADRAVSEGRTMVLEPMPARERRLIHLALRDRDDVRTESIGEGESRKVTIIPQ